MQRSNRGDSPFNDKIHNHITFLTYGIYSEYKECNGTKCLIQLHSGETNQPFSYCAGGLKSAILRVAKSLS